MGRINQLPASATLNSTDVIAVDAGTGGTTNKMTATNLAGQLKALGNYQDKLTFDTTPTAGSTNPVTSGGVKTALDNKQNTLTFDSTPTAGSTNPVTSGGIATAISQSTAFTETQLGATGYTEQVTYAVKKAIKQAGRVTIQLSCSFAINLPSSTDIARVPEGYRPNANVLVPAVVVTNTDAVLFDYAIVQSGGNIIQQATSNCRKVYICADYAL